MPRAVQAVRYVQPELDAVVAVAETFKPTIFDRIPFIEKNVFLLLEQSSY